MIILYLLYTTQMAVYVEADKSVGQIIEECENDCRKNYCGYLNKYVCIYGCEILCAPVPNPITGSLIVKTDQNQNKEGKFFWNANENDMIFFYQIL